MEAIKQEIEKFRIKISDKEWSHFSSSLKKKKAKKRTIIFRQTEICDEMIYISNGILASEYNQYSKKVITRFFRKGDLCSNIVSANSRSIAHDNIISITDVEYISFSYKTFMDLYLNSTEIGLYFRKKIILTLVEDKSFSSIKIITDVETKYAFMENNYPNIIRDVSSKYIAYFIGITPEALSRFLGKRYKS